MSLEGTMIDGRVVLDEPLSLPNGTRVEIKPKVQAEEVPSTLGERLQRLAGAIPDLPAVFADEHDHYIHGTPRRPIR